MGNSQEHTTKKNFPKILAWFSIIIGLFNIIMWLMLLFTNQIPNWQEEIISFIFHWISEISMALLMISAGILILRKVKFHRSLWVFADGMLFIAIFGATLYYTFIEFDIAFIIMGIIISLLSFVLFLKVKNNLEDLILWVLGISIYTFTNVIGIGLQNSEFTTFVYSLVSILCLIIASIFLLIKGKKDQINDF